MCIEMKKLLLTKVLLLLFLLSSTSYAQVRSIQSGLWSDPSTWETNQIPSETDDVIVSTTHHVVLDLINSSNYNVVKLCHDLNVEENAYLSIGHNVEDRIKKIRIFGDIICDGVIYKGEDLEGTTFNHNTRVDLEVQSSTAYLLGRGAFNVDALKIYSNEGEKNVIIDHSYMNIDDDFFVKSVDKVHVNISEYSYLNVKGTFGLNGQSYAYIDDNTSSEITNEGVIYTANLNLLTKNQNTEAYSKLIVKDRGFVTAEKINNEDLSLKNTAATVRLVLKDGGTLRLMQGTSNPKELLDDNLWVTVMTGGEIRTHYQETAVETSELLETVEQHRPSNGYVVDESFKEVYGATFTGGLYHFTEDPYFKEGIEHYKEIGSKTIKTKVSAEPNNMQKSYPFNMSWSGTDDLVEVVKDPHYKALFEDPYYKEHVLWITPKKKRINNVVFYKYGAYKHNQYFKEHEEEYYRIAKHLLETYSESGKKFLFQNWEGDWMLRGQGISWENDESLIPENVDQQIEGMIRLFQARQRGVDRARTEVENTTASIYHGIEINKLWTKENGERVTMMDLNVPSLTGEILPHVRTDFNSWSSYDGVWTEVLDQFPIGLWKGVEVLEYYTNESGRIVGESPIQLGEFGINENQINNAIQTKEKVEELYDKMIGCALAQKWNNFFIWAFYSTDTKSYNFESGQEYSEDLFYQYSDGKWIVEPDGSLGIGGTYFAEVLKPDVITAVNSGNWTTSSTWNQRVPTAEDYVVIPENINVVLDTINTNNNTEVTISKRLKVDGNLAVGHNASHTKIVRVEGDIFVNGIIEKGDFTKNARLYQKLPLMHNTTKGNGTLNVLTMKYFEAVYDVAYLNIDQSNIDTEEHFFIKSDNKVLADVSENTTVNVGQYFGLTGSSINWLGVNAQAEMNIYGEINTHNVNMLTYNTDASKASKLTVKPGGVLTTSQVNQQNQSVLNSQATFTFSIENGGIFNTTASTLQPSVIAGYDQHFIFEESSNGRLRDESALTVSQVNVFLEEGANILHINKDTEKELDLFLFDINGQLLLTKKGIHQSTTVPLNIGKGLYLIKYTYDGQEKRVKILL